MFRAMQTEATKTHVNGAYAQQVRRRDILEFIGTATSIHNHASSAEYLFAAPFLILGFFFGHLF